jgi:intracellular sulfur oxidation DsrE/DsrF family protein
MKTVIHLTDGASEAQDLAIRYVTGLLGDETLDDDGVSVVASGDGLSLVSTESTEADRIADRIEQGARFAACGASMHGQGMSMDDLLPNVDVVETSVGELSRLQADGYAYIKAP